MRRSAVARGPLLLLLILALACARGADPVFAGPLPGAPPPDAALVRALENAWSQRGPAYRPRTRHLREDGSPIDANRLFLESSPDLRQHAHNPVNWYPWGDEAFAAARSADRGEDGSERPTHGLRLRARCVRSADLRPGGLRTVDRQGASSAARS